MEIAATILAFISLFIIAVWAIFSTMEEVFYGKE